MRKNRKNFLEKIKKIKIKLEFFDKFPQFNRQL